MFVKMLLLAALCSSINTWCVVSFVDGMAPNKNFTSDSLGDLEWALLKTHYDHYINQVIPLHAEYKIPKIIHHIWLGSPMPELYKEFRRTWIDKHPGWKFMFWDDERIAKFGLINQAQYDAAHNFGQKSDIARYEILYRFGGLYVDTDFVCLQSFDRFHKSLNFYSGIAYDSNVVMFNGLIASAPNHPILQDCIYRLSLRSRNPNRVYRIMEETGPYYFTRCVLNRMSECEGVVMFPCIYFYPFFGGLTADYNEYLNDKNSFAVHLYHSSWAK
jgi:inositol phosphorylceramide mannosyltransferase catalytic subunit